MRSALLSVSNRSGLIPFAESLLRNEFELIATDGTADVLRASAIGCTRVSDLTGWPEMLSGRVKSLHPAVFGGILADRSKEEHLADMVKHNLRDISVVAVNLYPFSSVTLQHSLDKAVSLMDIGGVACLRAAAKTFQHVSVFSDPEQYGLLEDSLASVDVRHRLAASAFQHTSHYDHLIASYLFAVSSKHETASAPAVVYRRLEKVSDLKYGCNPHQKPAAIYRNSADGAGYKLLNGNWGYINLLDASNAWNLVSETAAVTGTIAATSFKHTQPTGLAIPRKMEGAALRVIKATFGVDNDSPKSVIAYARARNADPLSSFGDFIGFSGVVDRDLAEFVNSLVSDGIVAAGYTEEALQLLKKKKKGTFVVIQKETKDEPSSMLEMRDIGSGCILAQARNNAVLRDVDMTKSIPTERKQIPASEIEDLILANAVLKFSQSNSIAVATQGQVIAVASGQQSRIDAVRLAAEKANIWMMRHDDVEITKMEKSSLRSKQDRIIESVRSARSTISSNDFKGWKSKEGFICVLASDGFFPFADGIEESAAIKGLQHISQPGGSLRDDDVIQECNKRGFSMSMTGTRIFSH